MKNKFIQFELWKDCSQCCPFCFNRGQMPINKTESCQYVMEQLEKLKPNDYDSIGLIGGEFFNGEMQYHMHSFFLIMRKIAELNPKKIFLTTNLIYNIGDYLIPVLKALDKVLHIKEKLVLCTSWDKEYRFHNHEESMLWVKNMLWLKNHYPEIDLHVEMIMTQHLIDAVINDRIDLKLFQQIFRCSLDFIEPSSGLFFKDKYECQKAIPGFFPTKSSFIKFLQKTQGIIDFSKLFSMDYRSDELHYHEDGLQSVATGRRLTEGRCELRDRTRKYDIGFIDSNDKMRDVVLAYMDLCEC